MAINYNWTFGPLEAYPTHGGETDVVFVVHWQYHAVTGSQEESGSYYTAQSIGTIGIPYQSGSEFIPFDQLTFNEVEGWVVNAMGTGSVENLQTSLASNITNQITPKVVYLPNPWETTTTTTSTTTTTTTIAE